MESVNRIDTTFEIIEEGIKNCTQCPLYQGRTHSVPGEGPEHPALMLIGEAPGRNEDLQGKPFVGASGKKLTELLEQAGISRKETFITSVNKCRPPENRPPTKEEAEMCMHLWLIPQMHLLQPKVIGLMGRTAISYVMGESFEYNLEKDHGKVIEKDNKKFVLLYHPAAMIYNQKLKEKMQIDFQNLAKELK